MINVSVIIPCYNQANFLPASVDSVLKQSYESFEIIIVNDGSSDNTETIAKELLKKDDRIKYIHQENKGLSAARNFGIENAVGEFILPLDTDDKIHREYLEKAISTFNVKSEIDIVYGNAEYFGDMKGEWILPEFEIKEFLRQNLIYCSAVYRKSLFLKTKGYNPNMKYGWEDWDLWLSMFEIGAKVYKIPEVVFYYRRKKNSMVNDIAEEKKKRQYLEQQLISNHLELYKKHFPEPLTLLREFDFLSKEKDEYERYKSEIYNSASYKLGNLILSPLKLVKKIFK